VLFWSVFLGIEAFSWVILGSLLLMSTGAGLMTAGNGLDFSFIGALVLLIGIALGGFRWALSQVLLQCPDDSGAPEPAKLNGRNEPPWKLRPLEAVVLLAPVTALCLTPSVMFLELRPAWRSLWSPMHTATENMVIVSSLAGIAVLVFGLLWLEYAIVQMTSSLAISVVSIMKELLTILAGMIAFGDRVSVLSIIGLLLSQFGFIVFLHHRQRASDATTIDHRSVPAPSTASTANERLALNRTIDVTDDIEQNS
jgi:drug/metabolite transporter (DMT)-like permease